MNDEEKRIANHLAFIQRVQIITSDMLDKHDNNYQEIIRELAEDKARREMENRNG